MGHADLGEDPDRAAGQVRPVLQVEVLAGPHRRTDPQHLVEAAKLLEERPPNGQVRAHAEEHERPIGSTDPGIVERQVRQVVLADLDVRRHLDLPVDHVDLWVLREAVGDAGEPVRRHDAIVVDERHQGIAGLPGAQIARPGRAGARLADVPEPAIACGQLANDALSLVVVALVDHDHPEVGIGVRQHARDVLGDPLRPVPGRHDDGDGRERLGVRGGRR